MSTDLLIHTADDLFEMPNNGYRYELVQGVLRKMSPAGGEHGRISLFLGASLLWHVEQNGLGAAYGAETGFKIAEHPDTVLAPDVAFVAQERIQEIPDERKYIPLVPDLAMEVLSPGDTERESLAKADQWLSAGARAVILVNPRAQTVTVRRSGVQSVILTIEDKLEVPDIVPGWSIPVVRIFGKKMNK